MTDPGRGIDWKGLVTAFDEHCAPDPETVSQAALAFIDSGGLLEGGLVALGLRALIQERQAEVVRIELTSLLNAGAQAVSGQLPASRQHARFLFLVRVIDRALAERGNAAPELAFLWALLLGDRLIREGAEDPEARHTWSRWAYRVLVPQDPIREKEATPVWPAGNSDAHRLAVPLALQRDRLQALGKVVMGGGGSAVAKAAAVRRLWQLSRVPWSS